MRTLANLWCKITVRNLSMISITDILLTFNPIMLK